MLLFSSKIAPFHIIIIRYLYLLGKEIGPMVLFFGCRNRKEDFIYESELKGYLENGTLTELHVAFSREQAQKVR